jgi:hypothetical protein
MIRFLLHRSLGLSRCDTGFYSPRIDRDRRIRFLATLTCHFFHLLFLELDVCALAVGMIESGRTARLVFSVGPFALNQSGAATAGFTARRQDSTKGTNHGRLEVMD